MVFIIETITISLDGSWRGAFLPPVVTGMAYHGNGCARRCKGDAWDVRRRKIMGGYPGNLP